MRGGRIAIGVVGEPATLDPYSPNASDLTLALARPVYPSLYRLLPGGSAEPYLASSLERIDGGVRVTLAEMRWSNGRAITASDVVASARRARPPSGFARLSSVRAIGPRVVELTGEVDDWEASLATAAFVLPGGRAAGPSGGPFSLRRYQRGLKVVYEPNLAWGDQSYLDRATVYFVESQRTLLQLLDRRRLDAAVPGSSLNLDERLDELGLEHAEALGWESIYLDLHGADWSRAARLAFAAAIDRSLLEEGFGRDDARVANTLHPNPGERGADGEFDELRASAAEMPSSAQIAAPSGDELLTLLQRAIQLQLQRRGADVDLIIGPAAKFYGAWEVNDPFDVAIRRAAGAPGLDEDARGLRRLDAFPLFHVETVLGWNDGLHGPEPNPTLEGPFWNLEEWWVERGARRRCCRAPASGAIYIGRLARIQPYDTVRRIVVSWAGRRCISGRKS